MGYPVPWTPTRSGAPAQARPRRSPRLWLIAHPAAFLLFFLPVTFSSVAIAPSDAAAARTRNGLASEVCASKQTECAEQALYCARVERCDRAARPTRVARSALAGRLDFRAPRAQAMPKLLAQGSASAPDSAGTVKIVFGVMAFMPGSDRLTDVGTGRCQLVLRKFRQRKHITVVVESAAGPMEARDAELKLNRRRAEAVREQLLQLGLPPDRMSSPVFGTDDRAPKPGADWARPAQPKVEFTIRAGS